MFQRIIDLIRTDRLAERIGLNLRGFTTLHVAIRTEPDRTSIVLSEHESKQACDTPIIAFDDVAQVDTAELAEMINELLDIQGDTLRERCYVRQDPRGRHGRIRYLDVAKGRVTVEWSDGGLSSVNAAELVAVPGPRRFIEARHGIR